MQIKVGDAVKHQNYPIGIVTAIRHNLANGQKIGIVQLHGYATKDLEHIPLAELSIDDTLKAAA
jgi:hypothetical protein